MIKIGIVDDHQIVIDGLKLLLSSEKDFEITLESNNGFEMLEKLKNTNIDILLTDIMMPIIDGYELAVMVKKEFPNIKILALSMNGDGTSIYKMINKSYANGFLVKTTDKFELITAIKTIIKSNNYYSKEILEELRKHEQLLKQNEGFTLTSRELEIVKCIAEGLSNKKIAESLFISERTVETHRKNIFRKTQTHSAVSLIEFAKKYKLI